MSGERVRQSLMFGVVVALALAVAPATPAAGKTASTRPDRVARYAVDSFGNHGHGEIRTVDAAELGPLGLPEATPTTARGRESAAGIATHPVTVVPVNWPGLAADATTPAQLSNTVDTAIASYWDDNTGGAVKFTTTSALPWTTLSSAPSNPCGNPGGLANQIATQLGWVSTARSHLVMYLPSLGCGWAGVGSVGGSTDSGGWALLNANASVSVLGHELGHNISLEHSWRSTCFEADDATGVFDGAAAHCGFREYYDLYDIMGFAHTAMPGDLNPGHLQKLGLASLVSPVTVNTLTMTAPVTIDLAPRSAAAGTEAIKLVGGDTYWVEYRTDAGRDAWLNASSAYAFHPGVVVRRMFNPSLVGRSYLPGLLDATPVSGAGATPGTYDPVELAVDTVMTTQDGVRIVVKAQDDAGATVKILPPTDTTAPPDVDVTRPARTYRTDGTWVTPDSAFTLKWQAVKDDDSGVDHYLVMLDGTPVATVPRAAGVTTYTEPVVLTEGPHVLGVKAVDVAGNTGGMGVRLPYELDSFPPVVDRALALRLRAGAFTAGDAPVAASWSVRDPGSGLRTLSLRHGSASAQKLKPSASSTATHLRRGRYTSTLVARDWAGRKVTSTVGVALTRPSESAASYSRGWGRRAVRGSFAGRELVSTSRSATATFRFNGRAVAWVGSRGPGRGVAVVRVDGGAPQRVTLRADRTQTRRALVARNWSTSGAHTLTITVRRGSVAVDGFVVLK